MDTQEIADLVIYKLNNQPNEDSFLYRYITIDKLLDSLINERLPLTRLNIFEDKLEGITPEHLLLNLKSKNTSQLLGKQLGGIFERISINISPTKRNILRRQRVEFQNHNFANCWFISKYESVAMWQLYSKPDSVAIKIPYKSLISEINCKNFELTGYDYLSLKYGKTHYCDFSDLNNLETIEFEENIQGFFKDKSFEHEQEFRLMLEIKTSEGPNIKSKENILDEQVEKMQQLLDLKVIYLNLHNFKNMNFEIIFNPKSQPWHRENVKNIIKDYSPNFKTKESNLSEIFNK